VRGPGLGEGDQAGLGRRLAEDDRVRAPAGPVGGKYLVILSLIQLAMQPSTK